MSILTKKVTMTETAWRAVTVLLECVEPHCDLMIQLDMSDARTALAEAETIAVTDTYSMRSNASTSEASPTVDRWRRDAEQQGCRCGVCDNG